MAANKEIIRQSIMLENSSIPFQFWQTNVLTNKSRAYFPYTNWFQGKYNSCLPIIAEREAGFQPRIFPEYNQHNETLDYYPNHCFRGAVQQTKPCYPNDDDNVVSVKKYDSTILDEDNARIFLYK
jgi:hypothetical protein